MHGEEDLSRPASLDRAYRRHSGRAYAAAIRVLRDRAAAEDVVQEVFVSLWRNPGQFDSARGSLRSYVTMLARSRALDRWRAQAAHDAALEREARAREAEPRASASSPGADEPTLARERAREVAGALDTLPESQREAVLLAFGGGLTAREIARVEQIPLGTAKSRIRLGLEKARESLEAVA